MGEFLTREEIRSFYDKILNRPGYIKTLKRSINEAKVEQILSYAREVYMEAAIRLERESGSFQPVAPYNFPPCPLFTDIFVLPNGIKLDSFTYKDQLKYWLLTSKRVIVILEDLLKPGRKKLIPTSELRLDDVLIEGESADDIRSYYNFRNHNFTYLGKFLRVLQLMGYFTRKLSSPELQAIGRNDFNDPAFNDRNDNKPPALEDLEQYPEFRDIPWPGKKGGKIQN
jgi:hypothetical protein